MKTKQIDLEVAYSNLNSAFLNLERDWVTLIKFVERQSGSEHVGGMRFKRNFSFNGSDQNTEFEITRKGCIEEIDWWGSDLDSI